MTEQELIEHFPSLEKSLIDEIIKVADVKPLAAGELLMRTGQNIRSTLLVMDGLIKIYREDDQGNDFFMYYLDAGKACAVSLACALGQETSGLMARAVSKSNVVNSLQQFIKPFAVRTHCKLCPTFILPQPFVYILNRNADYG